MPGSMAFVLEGAVVVPRIGSALGGGTPFGLPACMLATQYDHDLTLLSYGSGSPALKAVDACCGSISLARSAACWTVVLQATETKNRRALGYSLPAILGLALERYLERFRPVLFGSAAHQGLWASAKGVPLTGNAIY